MNKLLLSVLMAFPFMGNASASVSSPEKGIVPQPCEKPVWPRASLRMGHEGKVTMRYFTDHDGTVLQAEVIESSGHPLLDEAARLGLMKCKMPNGQKADPALHAWNKIQYVWTMTTLTPQEVAARLAEVSAGAARGEPASMHEMGSMYMAGRGVPRDPQLGIEWLRKAADKGHPPSHEALAHLYKFGLHVTADLAESERLLRISAERGVASSQTALGTLLLRSGGSEARHEEGVAWLRKAADAGNPNAQSALGGELLRRAGADGDKGEALALLAKAAEREDPAALHQLGAAMLLGHGVEKDPVRALDFLTRAAASGSLGAQTTLAGLYDSGKHGVTPDAAKARHWRDEANKTLSRAAPPSARAKPPAH